MHLEFEHPFAFLLLAMLLCLYTCPRSTRKLLFPHLQFFKQKPGWFNKERLLYAVIATLMITALAAPISYEQRSPDHRKGRDLVMILDASGSMGESGYDAEHPHDRKFDTVRSILEAFIDHRYDDNIGVVLFGTFAFANAPLTYDRQGLRYLLQYADVGIAGENTAIGDAIVQATTLLKQGKAKKRVMILMTDGFQNSGSHSPKEGVALAKKRGIIIHTIGIGKPGDFDADLLGRIAKESGGTAFQAKDADSLESIYKKIDRLEPSPIRSEHYLNKHSLFTIPLLIAILLLTFLLASRYRRIHA